MRVLASTLAVALSLSFVTSVAFATPRFPGVLREAASAAANPECSVCHSGGVTTNGTVTTPFGQALRLRGLAADDETSLRNAFESLRVEGTDSDYDGISDFDEIAMGSDPNLAAGQSPAPLVRYGCSVSSHAHASSSWVTMLAMIALTAGGIAVRRRRSRLRVR